MYELSHRLKSLKPYESVAGEFSIRLDANESFIMTPDWLHNEISQAIRTIEYNRYPDPMCTVLCEKFAAFFNIKAELVTAGNGSDELISILINSFLEPNETLVILRPDFSMYSIYAEMANVKTAIYEKSFDELELDVDELINFVKTHNANMLMFSNPCNPTSRSVTKMDIIKIVENVDCLVVVDEAYMDFSEGSILQLAQNYDNLIVLKTCSKIGMAGIRLGFAIANPILTKVFQAVRSPYNINSMTQAVGCVWFSHREYIYNCVEKIKNSCALLFQKLSLLAKQKSEILQVLPSDTNFVFLHMLDANRIYNSLVQHGIAVRLMGKYLRITTGSETENTQLLMTLEDILR